MFFEFGIKDFIDIFLVAILLYYIYRLMSDSRSGNVFNGIMVFIVIWLLTSQVLETAHAATGARRWTKAVQMTTKAGVSESATWPTTAVRPAAATM